MPKNKTIEFNSKEISKSPETGHICITLKTIISKILSDLKKEAIKQSNAIEKQLELYIFPDSTKDKLLNLHDLEKKYVKKRNKKRTY